MRSFGSLELRPVVTTCPHCSYLVEGSCVVCADGDPHPGCEGCIDGHYVSPRIAWYRSDLVITIASSMVVAVVSTIVAVRLQHMLERRRAKRKG